MLRRFNNNFGLHSEICFWSPSELAESQEYERVAFPRTVPEMMKIAQQQKREKRESILARDADIAKNLDKLEQWKKDIRDRTEKKEKVSYPFYNPDILSKVCLSLGCKNS